MPGPEGGSVTSKAQLAAAADEPRAPARSSQLLTEPEFYRGTGVLARQTLVQNHSEASTNGDDVTFDFVNSDIREVVDLVLGDTLEENYVIDPAVQGSVTARTMRPLKRSAVFSALENVLSMTGHAVVKERELYRVVPIEQASQGVASPFVLRSSAARTSGFGTYIIPLSYIPAASVVELARPLVGPGRNLRFDAARNLLLFSGPGSDARDLQALVESFDVDWMEGMSFALFPVEVAEPRRIIAEMEVVFMPQAEAIGGQPVRFQPIDRLNAVLAISPQSSYLDQVAVWIERLDRGVEGPARRIFVYFVQNKRAEDLAEALSDVFEIGDQRQLTGGPGLSDRFVPDTLRYEEGLVPQEDLQSEGRGRTGEFLAGDPSGAPFVDAEIGVFGQGGPIRIIPNEESNALLVMATPSEYRMIEATLKKLDVEPLQVLIEVTIAEVILDEELRYGLQWFFRSGNNTLTFSSLGSGAVASAFPGFSYALTASDAQVVLNALTGITDVRVISSPQLMVLDNQSARLRVGDQVPIATQSAVSVTDPEAPLVNTIQFRDTGVILEVTPRVNASGLVVMEVIQEVSDVVETTTSDIDSPTIQQRTIESTVAVHSGESVALGGLIRDREEEDITGIPLLSEIPLLGNLFRTTGNSIERTELLVVITPRVVLNRDDAREVTFELQQRMDSLAPLEKKIR